MKKWIILILLSIFSSNFAQKQKKYIKSNEIIFSTEKFIFHSEMNNGEEKPSFIFLKNQDELNLVLNTNKILSTDDINNQNNTLKFPKNQKVILYNLGEFRSGTYLPKGIEKLRLTGNILEVYLIKEYSLKEKSSFEEYTTELDIQTITRPRIIFSVPQNFKFKTIITK